MIYYDDKIVGSSILATPGSGGGNAFSPDFDEVLILNQSEYDSLSSKSPATLYLIKG